jgi:GWxTD domain-containing protein
MRVPSGEYVLRATVSDRHARAVARAEVTLRAELGPARIGLSDLSFLRYTGDTATPNPEREIPVGETGHRVRLALHPQLPDGGEFRVRWRFSGASTGQAASGDTTVVLGKEPWPLEFGVPAERLLPGVHQLEVRLEGMTGRLEESRKATFFVRLTPQWFTLQRKEAWEVLELVATDEDSRALRGASDDEWPARVAAFWAARDPSPGTPENEFRDSIQQRMEAAATLFVEPFRKPGWRTDRGRTLIRFGTPDRRSVRTGDFEGPASELWEYDSPRRLFFFVDERGSGEFWLRV